MKSLEWSLDSLRLRLDCSHDFVCCLCDTLESSYKTRENSNILKKDKMVILVKKLKIF